LLTYSVLAPTHSDEPNVRKRIALRTADGMKLAGASITLTSFTDAVAFAIGSLTLLPALSSFCIFAVVGILCDYTLQLTLFVAFQALDALRVENKMVDVCPCCSPCCHDKCPQNVSAKVCPFGARVCFGAKELANGDDDEACTLYCKKKAGDADEADGAIEMPPLPAEGTSEAAGESAGEADAEGDAEGAKEGASGDEKDAASPTAVRALDIAAGEFSCMYRYILRESCSQFDSLPLTSLRLQQRAKKSTSRRVSSRASSSRHRRARRRAA
jgi:hypothetical protein